MTDGDRLAALLGAANTRKMIESISGPKARTVKCDILLGPIRRGHMGTPRRSVELVMVQESKSLDDVPVEEHTLPA